MSTPVQVPSRAAEHEPSRPHPAPAAARQRELEHDIRHELATIVLLASLLADSGDIGPASRSRIRQLHSETVWLDELVTAYQREFVQQADKGAVAPIRVDLTAAEAITAVRMTNRATFHFEAEEAWASANQLRLWRALRNVMDNAAHAAGPSGTVRVRVSVEDGWTVTQVDDDGPGFSLDAAGKATLGLRIVRAFAAEAGGCLETGPSRRLGGGCARILLPSSGLRLSRG
ncbi:sensor histidine kinase [Longispora albida]|uniref:sensor histidine kinase n=1 Tax=Longispora albida TaxID=203523 RepID=UPI00037C1941|nr:ATP-binding protein [Longispora albida]